MRGLGSGIGSPEAFHEDYNLSTDYSTIVLELAERIWLPGLGATARLDEAPDENILWIKTQIEIGGI